MCCFFTALVLFGPRLAILVWWLLQPLRWQAAFETWFWPFLGFIFVPWTTLMYVMVASGGIVGFDLDLARPRSVGRYCLVWRWWLGQS